MSTKEEQVKEILGRLTRLEDRPSGKSRVGCLTEEEIDEAAKAICQEYPIMLREEAEEVRSLLERGWLPPAETMACPECKGLKVSNPDDEPVFWRTCLTCHGKGRIPKNTSQTTSPAGQTAHYEKINNKWFIVWGADFPQDEPGKKEVTEQEAWLLECGYQVGTTPVKLRRLEANPFDPNAVTAKDRNGKIISLRDAYEEGKLAQLDLDQKTFTEVTDE